MSELKILPTPLKIMDGYIGFTKGKHQEVINRINKEIIEMHQNGEIEKIIDQYIVENL
jgi:ABC-type amino acid transport substrate-binding protein